MSVEAVKPKPKSLPRPLITASPRTARRYVGLSPLALSPDGNTLAFVSPKEGPAVVCEVAVAGGEPKIAFSIPGASAYGLAWSKTGDLFCSADRGGSERWQIYVRRPSGKVEDFAVSEGDAVQHFMSANAVSPDGRSILISSNGRKSTDVDALIADTATGKQQLVVQNGEWHVAGGWSPVGRWCAFMRVQQNTDQDLLAVDAESGEVSELTEHSGEMQNVSAGFLADGRLLAISDRDGEHLRLEAIDVHTGSREVVDQPEWDVEAAATSTDGRGIVWSVNEDGYSKLRWRFDGGKVGERELEGIFLDHALTHDGTRAAYSVSPISGPAEIHVLELTTGEDRLLLRGELIGTYPPRPQSIRIPGTEGDIPLYVHRPRGATGRTPVILAIHGGPEGQSRPALTMPLLQDLLEKGVAIVVPNIHGSTGYGKSWQTRIHKDWGGIDLADFRSIAEWMNAQPEFDPARMAVYGGSYGGFATMTCVTRLPEYWCCAVELFGPVNLVTMLENSVPNWKRWNRIWIGDLETDRERLIANSPMTHIDNVRCPLLVIQGTNDPRVPASESDQLVARLRELGRPVDYLSFEGEGHGLTDRENARLANQKTAEFFEKHLLKA